MEIHFYSAYERGYNSGAFGRPREAPEAIQQSIPDVSPEWYRGYDDAVGATEEDQKRTQATFQGNYGDCF